ncbi:hypothetical protein BJX66DRAFT_292194, partial [Aspergillus keveii]
MDLAALWGLVGSATIPAEIGSLLFQWSYIVRVHLPDSQLEYHCGTFYSFRALRFIYNADMTPSRYFQNCIPLLISADPPQSRVLH